MNSSNATASALGWDFQGNAAIVLMLRHIESASKVKIEGQTEDIEITLSNGKMLMSQAKFVELPDDTRNVKRNLKEGLRTLNNATKISDVERLIFVTNSPNPFNNETTMHKFSSPVNFVPFAELPGVCQKTVEDICQSKGYDFDTAKLTVCVMQFHGEYLPERYKVLLSETRDFLNSLDVIKVSTNDLLELWQHSFAVNATQRTKLISKKQMVWPIIAMQCKIVEEDVDLADYDDSYVDEIIQKYKSVINNNSERFEFVSRVLSDYYDFHPGMKSKEQQEKFIEESWPKYKDTFDLRSADDETKEVVIRLTLRNVLNKRRVISTIKGKVNL